MTHKISIFRFLSAFALLTVLAACNAPVPTATPVGNLPVTGGTLTPEPSATVAPTETTTPTPTGGTPTSTLEPTLNAVRTEAVATAFAGLTQTAQARPTRTLAPLWTLTPTLTASGCEIVSASPDVNSPIKPGAPFDGKWEVRNKGDGWWRANEVDIRYVSGTKFQTKTDAVDLKSDVDEEGTATVIVDMQAPNQAGTYVTNWGIYRGSSVVCGLSLTIRVQP